MKIVDYSDTRYPACFACKISLYCSTGGIELDDGSFLCADCESRIPGTENELTDADPPWDTHMMQTIEPHIRWRINQAMRELAQQYLNLKTSPTFAQNQRRSNGR